MSRTAAARKWLPNIPVVRAIALVDRWVIENGQFDAKFGRGQQGAARSTNLVVDATWLVNR